MSKWNVEQPDSDKDDKTQQSSKQICRISDTIAYIIRLGSVRKTFLWIDRHFLYYYLPRILPFTNSTLDSDDVNPHKFIAVYFFSVLQR